MADDNARQHRRIVRTERVGLALTAIVLAVAIAVVAALPFLAARWVQLPFLGAFLEQTLVFNSVGPQSDARWAAIDAGLKFPAQLIAVDEEPIRSTGDLWRVLAARERGSTVQLHYSVGGAPPESVSVTLQPFPTRDLIAYFVVPYLIGLVYLGIGLWVLRIRWREAAGRSFAVFCASVALLLGGLFDLYTTHVFAWAWTTALSLSAAGLITLALVFPQEARPVARYPALRWIGYFPALALAAATAWVLYDLDRPTAYAIGWRNQFAFTLAGIVMYFGYMIYRSRSAKSPIARGQARVILWGSALAFGPVGCFLLARVAGAPIVFSVTLYFPAMVAFPLAVAYAILRYRLLDTDTLIVRGLALGILTLLAVGLYAGLVYAASLLLGRAVVANSPAILAIFVVIFGLALDPLRHRLQAALDELFFRGTHAYREQLQKFGHALTTAADLRQVVAALEAEVDHVVRPTHMHIFLRGAHSEDYEPLKTDSQNTPGQRFESGSALADVLTVYPGALYLPPSGELPSKLLRDRERLSELESIVFIPFQANLGLAGWLALGARMSGEPYSREALGFLEALGDQAALAIERARLFDAEHEQRQLAEALSDTAAALTSTLDFDEVLERILENVGRVVEHDSANIMLVDGDVAEVVRRREIENDRLVHERVSERLRLEEFPTLKYMVSSGQPLLIGDTYADTRWNQIPQTAWVHSFAGAPIRVRETVIGFLNLNSAERDFFTAMDAEALQAFADQAGVAIENARLFDDLQRSHVEISQAYDATLEGWVRALDLRDQETEGHTQRVTEVTMRLGRTLDLEADALLHLRRGALLHDIGKIGIPDSILRKPGPLTDAEWDVMRRHPTYAYDMLRPITYLRPALDIPYCHHERWDGSGYPRGLRGDEIPLAARLFAMVDVWDALCSDRPYRKGWPAPEVIDHITDGAGRHFDPDIVDVFRALVAEPTPA